MKSPGRFLWITRSAAILACGYAALLQTAEPPGGSQPTVSQIAAGYAKYEKITPEPVYVNPILAMLCRGASKQEVEKERIKHGPHANTAVVIHMNALAANAFKTGLTSYPAGSVVVKQKTILGHVGDDGKFVRPAENGVGGMIKRQAGYDPAHGDWEYFYFEDVAKIESGRIASCVQCHDTAKATDHVFGSWHRANTAKIPASSAHR
jgi:hypothetical protein